MVGCSHLCYLWYLLKCSVAGPGRGTSRKWNMQQNSIVPVLVLSTESMLVKQCLYRGAEYRAGGWVSWRQQRPL